MDKGLAEVRARELMAKVLALMQTQGPQAVLDWRLTLSEEDDQLLQQHAAGQLPAILAKAAMLKANIDRGLHPWRIWPGSGDTFVGEVFGARSEPFAEKEDCWQWIAQTAAEAALAAGMKLRNLDAEARRALDTARVDPDLPERSFVFTQEIDSLRAQLEDSLREPPRGGYGNFG
ncbi:MAG: hypothetical protein WEB00_00550 [Dehalococcoidia bacterium]